MFQLRLIRDFWELCSPKIVILSSKVSSKLPPFVVRAEQSIARREHKCEIGDKKGIPFKKKVRRRRSSCPPTWKEVGDEHAHFPTADILGSILVVSRGTSHMSC